MKMESLMNDKPLLYPEAIKRVQIDLQRALTDWDFLSGVSGDGPIREFEKWFAGVAGGKYAIAMPNATSALFVSLMASGIGKGDEVILPAYTWPQTLTPVLLTGATAVFADIDADTVTISPESVKRLISGKTKAIIGVHLFGIPADVIALEKIARDNGCILIYDAAQGFGAFYNETSMNHGPQRTTKIYSPKLIPPPLTGGGQGEGGLRGFSNEQPIGAHGDYVAYSFGRSKLFSIGEGGALVCKNRVLYEKAIAFSQHPLRMHGEIDDPDMRTLIDGVSMNFRIHPLVASLALGQLRGLLDSGKLVRLKVKFKELYSTLDSTELRHLLPAIPEGACPSGACIPLLIKTEEALVQSKYILKALGIDTFEGGIHTPLHLTETIQRHQFLWNWKTGNAVIPFDKTHTPGSCPNTEERCKICPQLFIKTA